MDNKLENKKCPTNIEVGFLEKYKGRQKSDGIQSDVSIVAVEITIE